MSAIGKKYCTKRDWSLGVPERDEPVKQWVYVNRKPSPLFQQTLFLKKKYSGDVFPQMPQYYFEMVPM